MAHRESEAASWRSLDQQTLRSSTRSKPSSRELSSPLIDSEWLLGPKKRSLFSFRLIAGLVVVSVLLSAFVATAPSWSRAWLRSQLAIQFREGATPELRREGLIGLAKLLPESLTDIVQSFSRTDGDDAKSAYHALNDYIENLNSLPVEVSRARQAEMAYALEKQLIQATPEAAAMIAALATAIQSQQKRDSHPAAAVTIASCERILENAVPSTRPALVESQRLPPIAAKPISPTIGRLSDEPTSAVTTASTASLSDDNPPVEPDTAYSLSVTANQASATVVSTLSQPSIPFVAEQSSMPNAHPSIAPEPMVFTPIDHDENSSRVSESSQGSTIRQRLLKANRFVPKSGNMSVSLESNAPRTEVPTSEEVLGIRRQHTRDLLRLLSSVQPRVAQAAFHELESHRLNREELELAVELAHGSVERRIQALENLVVNPRLDPMPWLSWMAGESDRELRFKAVSLLGSLNNDEAKKQLRMMSSRERDQEISRHIQQALSANGQSSASNR